MTFSGPSGRRSALRLALSSPDISNTREIRSHDVAVAVELDRPFDRYSRSIDHDVVDPGVPAFVGRQGERGARSLVLRLDPAGQKIVDLGQGEVGLDRETAVLLARCRDLAPELDRN